ncbi:MAG: pyruvate kinase [Alphaproteobacteria bacterium]
MKQSPSTKNTKIIATLGPASSNPQMIESLITAGVNIFRLNFSHGTHETHGTNLKTIRSIEKRLGVTVGVLADLQGPKFRIGSFSAESVVLSKGQTFSLDLLSSPGSQKRVSFPHPEVYSHIRKGSKILLDDGKINLKVNQVTSKAIETIVERGGTLSNHKGVNIPEDFIPSSTLTPKDLEDLKFILQRDFDFIALSFVQHPDDIRQLKTYVEDSAKIIAKIEKPQAIYHLDEIIKEADGIMVARGDLGVEFPPENVPALQKKIVRLSRAQGKPVIVATQMLESMVHAPTPTRAEASDVATAVYDGADAVMLSAESATGKYPLESVHIMTKIILNVEQDSFYGRMLKATLPRLENTISDAITSASQQIVYDTDAKLIVTFTTTGGTALRESHKRPPCSIVALTESALVARSLTLAWGVVPIVLNEKIKYFEELTAKALSIVKSHKLANKGDRVVITFGVPFGQPGTTNIINVEELA